MKGRPRRAAAGRHDRAGGLVRRPGRRGEAAGPLEHVAGDDSGRLPFALLYDALVAGYFRGWPLPAATAVFPVFLAPLLTYAVMPGLSRVLRRWLYPQA